MVCARPAVSTVGFVKSARGWQHKKVEAETAKPPDNSLSASNEMSAAKRSILGGSFCHFSLLSVKIAGYKSMPQRLGLNQFETPRAGLIQTPMLRPIGGIGETLGN